MSTFVLKRKYVLQMPINYVEIDKDEMEYVDGSRLGKYWYSSVEAVGIYADVAIIGITGGIGTFSTIAARKFIKSIIGTTVTHRIANKLAGYVGSAVAGLFLVHQI